jgi:hypothetical protein
VLIEQHPNAAPVVHEGKVHARRVGRYQYRVFYVVEKDDLIIWNVAARDGSAPGTRAIYDYRMSKRIGARTVT